MFGFDFTGKVVLITGGGGGIPGGIAKRYAEAGAKVYLTDIGLDRLKAVADKMRADGLDIATERLDVTNEAKVVQVIDEIVNKEGKLDILVNGAGILYTKPYMETTRDEFVHTLDINLVGMHSCTQAALKHMIPRKYGKIINICSASTRQGAASIAHYSSSKFATMGLTQSVALAVAEYGINVNGICPGLVRTNIFDVLYANSAKKAGKTIDEYAAVVAEGIPMKRLQSAEDMGDAAMFLASEFARNITGQCLNVCGGMRMN